ncbi:gamma-glutamyl-gamma-aminobutyrate hydrolase family protein [Cypionkella psychrotolerans]|uniref:gamma-glutamyl-gamma-aminobutyrate hydrolase family protein n=1 Tax=Cypionkella psychrotolerans TaxID=1678131 RepID=UPI0006B634AA|nr:gamma-glutamyl-gamma-aminobutyrate hydrolase family protein [Cypionkella psychrotolerans]
MVPLIGVTSYGRLEKTVINPPDTAHYLVAATYVDAVRYAGGAPIVLPGEEPHLARWLDVLDGIVFSGGCDLDPTLFGGNAQHPALDGAHADRDRADLALAHAVIARGLPALFICRGIQVLNVALGGTLHEHIDDPNALHQTPKGAAAFWARERVEIAKGTALSTLLGRKDMTVSSSHHQAIATLAPALRIAATASDGVIEAVELDGHPFLLGVQWHPEVDMAKDPIQRSLFDGFIAAASAHADRKSQ